ncbi:MAG TPA: TolC family protein [Bryobacteraceae bacterium]|nr:TolC family protein [Bryobacteraceae bacterium]
MTFTTGLVLVIYPVIVSAQGPAAPPPPSTTQANIPQSGLTFGASPEQFQGSVPSGQATAAPIPLSLEDAIARGLKTNLGLLVRDTGNQLARIERKRALINLLPDIQGSAQATEQQLDLASFGFHFAGVPSVIGPFHYVGAQAALGQTVFDWTALKNKLSADQNQKAAQLSVEDGRDLVVQAVASAYLQIISDAARIEATKAVVATAQALYQRAHDQHVAGVSPAIDELRSQVELKTQQQVLLAQQNQSDKDKLALGRVIGLASGQDFSLTDTVPYRPLESLAPADALHQALETRADYRSALMQVRAAESARVAVLAERYPTLGLAANYGDIGENFNNSHGIFTVTGSLKFNIFDSGRIRSDIDQADAIIQQRRNELADLQGQIDFQIRAALLDLKTAADQVAVSQDNLNLANQTLEQARDRFAAGVADNIEVVQAQESVANANQSLISSIYMHNLAKVSLARAIGATATNLQKFMGGN